ncbi:MAG: hypothetical protein EHJ95_05970, partial [Methanobacteriota archaeon]
MVAIVTAAARAFSGEKAERARGSSWFSMKRTSFSWYPLAKRALTSAVAPGPLKDTVDEEHGHIAADAVRLAGDIRETL